MILLGIDVGTSSIKVSVVDADTSCTIASANYPEKEAEIIALKNGWAEQDPEMWWQNVQQAILKCHATQKYNPKAIAAIGIAYQMHGLVVVDKQQNNLRNSIIWCDSRAVEIGNKAFQDLGEKEILTQLLNSPGNFTAAKLAWVKKHEPKLFEKIDKMMLPGDFISMKLTGEITTNISSLSEGIFWDFKENQLYKKLMDYFGFDEKLIPKINPVFSEHGALQKEIADQLQLKAGIPVTYKAGDQPNNALSLNVSEPGEVAATAGTSGVIYGITDTLLFDQKSRVNTFAHVNYTHEMKRLGVLLCINGTGSMYRWAKNTFGTHLAYDEMNRQASKIVAGSNGLSVLPFGNGAERMLENKLIGAQISHIDLNQHQPAHLFRAVQEGIAFSFRYGLDILRENGMNPKVIRAGKANLFLSDVFAQTFVNITGVRVELFESDGSFGAAIGAGIGLGIYHSAADAFQNKKPLKTIIPDQTDLEEIYQDWQQTLLQHLNQK